MSSAHFSHALRPLLRLVFVFAFGLAGIMRGQTSVPAAWLHKARAGDVVYFTFASPARIERYDLAAEKWLGSIALTNTPTAFAVDDSGMVVAYGRALYTRKLDGSGETGLYTSGTDVRAVLLSPDFAVSVAGSSSSAELTSIRRSDRQFIATWSGYYCFGSGLAIDPVARRVYGIDTYTSGFSLQSIALTSTGAWPTGYPGYIGGPTTNYGYNAQARTYLAPDASFLVLGTGHVYDPLSLAYRTSLAGAFDDLAFQGKDVSVVLRGAKLVAYGNTFLESGSASLAKAAQGIAISGESVFAFSADAASAGGIAVTKVALASFSTAVPGAAPDPSVLEFVPDKVIAGPNDTVFLYSKAYKAIFSWDAATGAYGKTCVLGAVADQVAYSPSLNRLYTGYSTGEIKQIKLDEGATTETPFVNLPKPVISLQAAGSFVFAMDSTGAWGTHWIYSSDGVLKSSREWAYYSRDYIWSPVQKRLYQFRDDTSPNDLLYTPVSDAGVVGSSVDSPYHGDYSFVHPIRLSSDETGVLTGTGNIFSATSLSFLGSLANAITDGVSLNNRWHTIRATGTDTQLQVWSQINFFERGLTISGYPLRVFALSDGRLLVLTASASKTNTSYPYGTVASGRLLFSYVDLAGEGTVSTPAYVVTQPASAAVYRGRPASLSVVAGGTAPFTYQWKFKGEPIADATAASLTFASVKDADAGAYTVTVTNAYGSSTSAAATLTVATPPPIPVITTQPQSQSVSQSTYSVYLSVYATGASLGFQWYKNDAPIAGATSSTLSLYPNSAGASVYGDYQVVVSNPGGEVRSATARISPPPAPTITAQPQSAYALVGQLVRFSVTATSQDLTYQWRRDGVALSFATGSSYGQVVSEADFGDYDVVVSNSAGSVVSETARLQRAVPASIATQPASVTIPLGSDASFHVVASGAPADFTYRWQRYSSTSQSWVNIVPDPFYFTGTETDTLVVANASLARNGLVVRCVVSNGFGSAVNSAGATLTVNAASNPPIAFVLQPRNQTVTTGSAVAFTALTNSLTTPYYQWFHDGVAIPGANNPTLLISSASATDVGNYTLFAQNGSGAAMSEAAALSISDLPAAPALEAVAAKPTAFAGSAVTLRVRVTGMPAPTLTWTKDGKPLFGATGPAYFIESAALADAGLYRVTATNSSGGAMIEIRLAVRPPAPAAPALGTVRQGEIVSLDLAVETPVAGLRYRATGLPAGLGLDPATGLLSGDVRGKTGVYSIKAWSELGSAKSEVVSASVTVAAFPAVLTGAFEGILLTNEYAPAPANLLRLTVAASGEFTGSLLGSSSTRATALKGRLRLGEEGTQAFATLPLPEGTLALVSSGDSVAAQIQANESALASGLLAKLLPAKTPAVAWAGPYTLSFAPPVDRQADAGGYGGTGGVVVIGSGSLNLGSITVSAINPTEVGAIIAPRATHATRALDTSNIGVLPAGQGYASVVIAATGRLTAKGKLADGAPLTGTLYADADRGYRWFARPHAAGSNFLAGTFSLGEDETGYAVDESRGSHQVYWQKAPQARDTVHPAGFDAARVSLTLAPWKKPRAGDTLATLLGGPEAPAQAAVFTEFPQANDVNTAGLPPRLANSTGAKLLPAPDTPAAAARAWRFNVDLSTGVFTGRFLLPSGIDPLVGKPVDFEGVLLRGQGSLGRGYFILPAASANDARQSGAITFSWTE